MIKQKNQSLKRLGSKRFINNDLAGRRYTNLTYQNSKNSSLKDLIAPAVNLIDE
jgi:hypothetical protein